MATADSSSGPSLGGEPDFGHLIQVFEAIPHCRELGIRVRQVTLGRAVVELPFAARLCVLGEGRGPLHGGAVTTVLDTAGGLSVFAATAGEKAVATLDFRIDHLKPSTPGLALLGFADCYRVTASVAFVRGSAYHLDADDPISTFAASYMLSTSGVMTKGAGIANHLAGAKNA